MTKTKKPTKVPKPRQKPTKIVPASPRVRGRTKRQLSMQLVSSASSVSSTSTLPAISTPLPPAVLSCFLSAPSLSPPTPPSQASPTASAYESEAETMPLALSLPLSTDKEPPVNEVDSSASGPTGLHEEPERTKFKSIIRLNGFQYTKAGTSSKKVTYRCSFYRRKEKCKSRVDLTVDVMPAFGLLASKPESVAA